MKVETQQIIIICVTLVALALVIKEQYAFAIALATGLIGFIAPKTLTDKQSEVLTQKIEKDGGVA